LTSANGSVTKMVSILR